MSFEAVDVFVRDRTPMRNPIAGVVVKALNQAGTEVFSTQTTDVDGKASFLFEAPATYQLRFFKRHVNIRNPWYIEVTEAPETPEENHFDVDGEPFTITPTLNPRLCTAHGYFTRFDGSPAAHVDMHFMARFDPILLEDDAVLTERLSIRTDKNGFAQLNLIRFGHYDVTVESFEDYQRIVVVPDAPEVNLPDLIFPRVKAVSFDPVGPYTVAVDADLTLTPTVMTSSLVELVGTATSDVNWTSSNTNVLAVTIGASTLTLRGIAPGTAQLLCERLDSSIIRIPNESITGQPITVTVT